MNGGIDWAAWIPGLVSISTAFIVIGGYFAVTREHSKRLDDHDELHKETEKHDAAQDVALAELQAWQKGYAAARDRYDRSGKFERISDNRA